MTLASASSPGGSKCRVAIVPIADEAAAVAAAEPIRNAVLGLVDG